MRPCLLPVLLLVGLLPACTSTVTVDRDDEEEECGPKPGSSGWCPPAWVCIDGQWQDTAGACPEPTCPTTAPGSGDACELVGQQCSYTVEYGCDTTGEQVFECTSSGWETAYTACQPEPTCPLEMPVIGSDCSGWDYPYFCQYQVACFDDVTTVAMSCDYQTTPPAWQLDSPPQACGDCTTMGDAASCVATSGCQWLEPGCGENPVPQGCYPEGDCLVQGCAPDQVCVGFDQNPCWNSLCDACNAPIGLCFEAD